MPKKILSDEGLDLLFREARSYNSWSDKPISDITLQAVYDLFRWAPTSANCSPARLVFLTTDKAREKLRPHLLQGNLDKVATAPVTVIIGYDIEFYRRMDTLFPHNPDAKNWFTTREGLAEETAFRNGTLQGAYLMMAARSLGLDCGPMSGFDNQAVDAAFFPDSTIKSNFLCALGYGTRDKLFPRLPRLAFEEACRVE